MDLRTDAAFDSIVDHDLSELEDEPTTDAAFWLLMVRELDGIPQWRARKLIAGWTADDLDSLEAARPGGT